MTLIHYLIVPSSQTLTKLIVVMTTEDQFTFHTLADDLGSSTASLVTPIKRGKGGGLKF
jgi:hypothetical protein